MISYEGIKAKHEADTNHPTRLACRQYSLCSRTQFASGSHGAWVARHKHFVLLETGRHKHGSAVAKPFYKLDSVLQAHQMFQPQVNQQGVKLFSHIKILPGFNSLQALVQQYNNQCNATTLLSYKITVCMPSEAGYKRGRGKQLLHFLTTTTRSGSSMVFMMAVSLWNSWSSHSSFPYICPGVSVRRTNISVKFSNFQFIWLSAFVPWYD